MLARHCTRCARTNLAAMHRSGGLAAKQNKDASWTDSNQCLVRPVRCYSPQASAVQIPIQMSYPRALLQATSDTILEKCQWAYLRRQGHSRAWVHGDLVHVWHMICPRLGSLGTVVVPMGNARQSGRMAMELGQAPTP